MSVSRWLRITRLPKGAAYGVAAVAAAAAVGARLLLDPLWGTRLPFILFFPVVMLIAWIGGFGPGLFATASCALAADFFWMRPAFSLTLSRPANSWALLVFAAVGVAISAFASEWRRASEGLHASEERFRLAIDAAPAAVILVDSRGRILVANELAERTFGWTREELVGRGVEDLVPARFRGGHEGYRTGFFGSLERRPMGAGRDLYGLRKDGTEVPVEIGLAPFSSGDETVVMATITDISERKRAAERAEAAMRARENFVSEASHELRGPLAALRLQIEVLARRVPPEPADLRGHVERARSQADRLVRLIHDLLDQARIAAGALVLEPEESDFREIVRAALDRLSEEGRAGEAVVQVPDEPVVGRWDRARVGQIVENLLVNAVKYGRERPIAVTVAAQNDSVVLSVADQGVGIEPEHRARLFQPFQRGGASARGEGFGLGLWISRQIVGAMGGTITVESVPGEGSTFTVVLPRVAGAG